MCVEGHGRYVPASVWLVRSPSDRESGRVDFRKDADFEYIERGRRPLQVGRSMFMKIAA